MAFDWQSCRTGADGYIDLIMAYAMDCNECGVSASSTAITFLRHVQDLQPIKSRQIAALALAQARVIGDANG